MANQQGGSDYKNWHSKLGAAHKNAKNLVKDAEAKLTKDPNNETLQKMLSGRLALRDEIAHLNGVLSNIEAKDPSKKKFNAENYPILYEGFTQGHKHVWKHLFPDDEPIGQALAMVGFVLSTLKAMGTKFNQGLHGTSQSKIDKAKNDAFTTAKQLAKAAGVGIGKKTNPKAPSDNDRGNGKSKPYDPDRDLLYRSDRDSNWEGSGNRGGGGHRGGGRGHK